ncbi:MAG TPA: UDP-N-acetylmuramoyl-L-alanine--D-glutamate ligase [Fimbriimonadaceae bacterium]|nr:UDP-N-acetylmuramoyl-L-alanine--D-glutamate ligase [Fimbriimonadaceae bacterium]
MNVSGRRFAIAGMAKSGLSIARAVKQLGGSATVFDQKPSDSPAIIAAIDELHSIDVQAVPNWHGHIDPDEYDVLVVSPGFPRNHPAIKDMAEREVIGEIEFAYRLAHAPIVAITGTNGKSTTTVLTWTLLTAAGRDAVLCGNIAGSGYPEVTLTDAAISDGDVLVAEVSSFQLETVSTFRPFVAAITSLAPDHLDRHPDFEDYKSCKLRLFAKMRESDTVVINLDEKGLDKTDYPEGMRKVRFSPSGTGPTNGYTARLGEDLLLCGEKIKAKSLPIIGEHNVANAMMAWEIACAVLGEPSKQQVEAMLSALLKFRGLDNRMERVGAKNGVLVINNSMCTNPAAVVASSKGLDRHQRLILGGNRKSLDFSPVGEYLKASGHAAYVFGPDTEGLNKQLGHDWPAFKTMQEAFEAATNDAEDRDAIILMPGCASAEPYANFRERGDAFRELARRWLSA